MLQQLLAVRNALPMCVRSHDNEGAQQSFGKARNVGVGAGGSYVTFPFGSFVFRHRRWKVRDQDTKGEVPMPLKSQSKLQDGVCCPANRPKYVDADDMHACGHPETPPPSRSTERLISVTHKRAHLLVASATLNAPCVFMLVPLFFVYSGALSVQSGSSQCCASARTAAALDVLLSSAATFAPSVRSLVIAYNSALHCSRTCCRPPIPASSCGARKRTQRMRSLRQGRLAASCCICVKPLPLLLAFSRTARTTGPGVRRSWHCQA